MNIINEKIIKFIERAKFKLKQIIIYKKKIFFYKKIFWSMIDNLTELNYMNYYSEFNYFYLEILNKMNLFKDFLDKINKNNNYKYYKVIKIEKQLENLINYIAPKDLNLILTFYNNMILGDKHPLGVCIEKVDWVQSISTILAETDLSLFIKFIRPVCIWDSDIHTIEQTNLPKNNKINNNNIIQSIIGYKQVEVTEDEPLIFNNFFKKEECKILLLNNNILIKKNSKAQTLIENKQGCCIYLKIDDKYVVIQGLFKDDLFNISISNKYVKNMVDSHLNIIKQDSSNIPHTFSLSYFNVINLRDRLLANSKELCEEIKKKYNDFKNLQTKSLMLLINEFLLASKYRKIDILTLFLISNDDDQSLAYILFDILKIKDKKNTAIEIYNSLHFLIRNKLDMTKKKFENEEKSLLNITESDIPYERKINLLKVDLEIKTKAIEKLKLIKNNFQGDAKAQSWLDGLLKIPFNIYSKNEILSFKKNFIKNLDNSQNNISKLISDNDIELYLKNINDNKLNDQWLKYKIDKKNYLYNIRNILDKSVYGHKESKNQLQKIFCQWINGQNSGAVLGLHGPPGVGKTSLIKNGLSKCLMDSNGNYRPFTFLPIGGSVNGSTLVGHNYTYVGSTWGKIVDILISSKCMNPIIFIDELDKISSTEHGREIISILTQITDSTQNDEFEDKFFSGVKLDLSKVLFIFSFNDMSLIDHVLKDRITVIDVPILKLHEKLVIIKDYMLPEICKDVGININEIVFDELLIKYLIETYTLEPGVRKIKEKIIDIIREINLQSSYDEITFPFTITKDFCEKLFELKHKIKPKKIINDTNVGIVNGLYASNSGIGGITYIQTIKYPSTKILDLDITGLLGESMKESVQYSSRIAFNLLDKNIKDDIVKNPFGIHIHCPEAAVKKDGPSAGAAITLAIYSLLTNKKINNKIALTGEIDIMGNITAIGGLELKLNGAKRAGIELALYPEENEEDIIIMRKEGNSPEDDDFKIAPIKNIYQLIKIENIFI